MKMVLTLKKKRALLSVSKTLRRIAEIRESRSKVFCPTGPGGGIDPGCGTGGGAAEGEEPSGGGGAPAAPSAPAAGGGKPKKPPRPRPPQKPAAAPKPIQTNAPVGTGHSVSGEIGKLSGVSFTHLNPKAVDTVWAMKKIEELEKLAAKDDWTGFAKKMSHPKQPWDVLTKQQKLIIHAQENLLKQRAEKLKQPPKGATPIPEKPPVLAQTGWNKIGGQMGTEKGGVYEMGGNKYYVKVPDQPERTYNEVMAAKLYELAGAGVVKSHLVDIDGKAAFASEFIDSKKVDWKNQAMKNMAAPDFAIHAWLNNRDAIGAGTENPMDNIRMDSKTGKLTLVDAGGSLNYSGMGGSGKKQFGKDPIEWEGMRNPQYNPTMAEVYGGMTKQQLVDSANRLKTIKKEDVKSIVDSFGKHMSATEKTDMVDTLMARKDGILAKAKALEDEIKKINANYEDYLAQSAAKPSTPKPSSTPVVSAPPVPNISKPAPALPPKPIITAKSYLPALQPKIDKIAELAAKGDIKGISAIKTSDKTSDPYYQKVHQFKMDTLVHLAAQAAKGNTAPNQYKPPVPPPTPAAKKLSVPDPPSGFGERVTKSMKDMWQYAKDGDLESLRDETEEFFYSESSGGKKAYEYGKELQYILKKNSQAAATPAPNSTSVASVASSISTKAASENFKAAIGKAGKWNILDEHPSPPPPTLGTWQGQKYSKWKEGEAIVKKEGGEVLAHFENYTGFGHSSMNAALRGEGKMGVDWNKHHLNAGTLIAKTILEKGIELEPGLMLSRKHFFSLKDLPNLKVGHIVSDKGNLSTSTDPDIFSGNVKWRLSVGPGVKGMPVDSFSLHKGESEIILAPNQRLLITKINQNPSFPSDIEIFADVLPTLQNQCCPP